MQTSKFHIVLLALFLLSTCGILQAQDFKADLLSLTESGNNPRENLSNNKRIYNPLKLLSRGFVVAYQKTISPQLASTCIYEPTCSHFSVESMQHFGFFKSTFLSIDRISRCNRVYFVERKTISRNREGKIIEPASFYYFRTP